MDGWSVLSSSGAAGLEVFLLLLAFPPPQLYLVLFLRLPWSHLVKLHQDLMLLPFLKSSNFLDFSFLADLD